MIPRPPALLGLILSIVFAAPAPTRAQEEAVDHWSFGRLRRPAVPDVRDDGWVRNPIDAFLLNGLETAEISPSHEADRVELIRRLTYDLTGLPPTPSDVDRFRNDDRPDAYERLVDRLLASPAYGERWAQHWLDLAHYADSNGFELDAERPDAWRYRDWVVSAFNRDLPYDRFLGLQLAGDEIAPGDHEALIATGFGRSGPREVVAGNIDPKVRRQSELTGVTGTVGSVFLGLTVACARCHDHKFDPIPQADYYGLEAFFAASQFVELPIADDAEEEAYREKVKAIDEAIKPIKAKLAELEAPYRKALRAEKEADLSAEERRVIAIPAKERTPAEKKLAEGVMTALKIAWEEVAAAVSHHPEDHEAREALKRAIHELGRTKPRPPAKAMALADRSEEAPETLILRRGDVHNPADPVEPHPLRILRQVMADDAYPAGQPTAGPRNTGRRSALARWLTHPDHPLTARVIVNRLWQQHFGRGIVATPSDFGTRGEPPTHPELLDWLAVELIDGGWSLKPIHRLMVTSAAYRQSSQTTHGREIDPENTLFWRANRRRLDAEGLRDGILAASGSLNPKMGGPGVLAPIEKEVEDLIFTEAEEVDLWPETADPIEHRRRSLYLFRKRNVRYTLFDAFDTPDTQTSCPERTESIHAPQALYLLNSAFAGDGAARLARALFLEVPGDPAGRIRSAYRRVLGREPRSEEISLGLDFLANPPPTVAATGDPMAPGGFPDGPLPGEAAAWIDFCLAMLNRNEFLYIP